eukprot:gene13063-biopygen7354
MRSPLAGNSRLPKANAIPICEASAGRDARLRAILRDAETEPASGDRKRLRGCSKLGVCQPGPPEQNASGQRSAASYSDPRSDSGEWCAAGRGGARVRAPTPGSRAESRAERPGRRRASRPRGRGRGSGEPRRRKGAGLREHAHVPGAAGGPEVSCRRRRRRSRRAC